MEAHLPDRATPFPIAHLSSVNVDGVEVCCHQGPQHEEEANEAGTKEQAEEVIAGDTEDLLRHSLKRL